MSKGKVWLVGAGPGDPGLFTVKGKEILSSAEVVVYDSLVGQGVLSRSQKKQRLLTWENGLPIIQCPRKRSIRSWWRKLRKAIG